MPNLKFITSDEIPVLIDFETIKCSGLIRSIVENSGFTDEIIPLIGIDYCVMQLILKWVAQHKNDPPVPDDYEDERMDINEILEWDKKYFDIGQDELLELIRAAHYLQIPKLVEYCYKTVALLITGKTAPEMLQIFGIDQLDNEEDIDSDTEIINDEKEIGNELEFGLSLSSDAERPLKKRKIKALEDSEAEKSSHQKRKSSTTKETGETTQL